ncbi:hypothetical protein [Hyphomicrobium sp. 99]|uniref:hypothetical protein n=1 Tax=Hyphomicrobium sp. 99 TaxID=1163419 RepID=UPI0006974E23|nr:hypothetical protein [Hyphomicrobium sp. 99]
MIYDCFTFYNELDILEIRLHELYEVVDRFVLVEANWTFQGNPKPLYFAENKSAFSRYADKIIYVRVDFPDCNLQSRLTTGPRDAIWAREHFQREQISQGLKDASPEDLIIVGDVDEIISAAKLREAIAKRRPRELTIFEMPIYTGSVNRRLTGSIWEKGPRMIEFSDFPGAQHLRLTKVVAAKHLGNTFIGRFYTRYQNYILRGMAIRLCVISDSGWHMTSIGDWTRYRDKILAYSHMDRADREDFKYREAFERRLSETTTPVDLAQLPKFVQENSERFAVS